MGITNYFLDRAKAREERQNAKKIKEAVDEFGHHISLPPGFIKLPIGLVPILLDDDEETEQECQA